MTKTRQPTIAADHLSPGDTVDAWTPRQGASRTVRTISDVGRFIVVRWTNGRTSLHRPHAVFTTGLRLSAVAA